ncbi:hypothetical protein E2C01_054151 [Portunus trituberculatus]|uniref:Uncharacterized protein n=1 Tax=Portunus trituberculatus TaxID=210409 RepID=A0A5B7GU83_PORTR|nr:hypothetical protein [Portunus trituberculatus]
MATRNVPRSDCSLGGDPKCLDTSLNFFVINHCNIKICGLTSNFQSLEHHLSSAKPHLFLTESQLSEATNSSVFSVPCYFLYPHFRSKAGCCVHGPDIIRSSIRLAYLGLVRAYTSPTHSTTIDLYKEKIKIGLKMARSDYDLAHGCLGACDTGRGQGPSGSDWLAGPLHHTDPGPT